MRAFLARRDDGNLHFTTDFRSVYATVLERVVGVDPKVSLGRSFLPGLRVIGQSRISRSTCSAR
ncbi:MAG: hypothetical protein DLM54_07395 [Acidimicrobiales bacterium]|nr:MAG: hypothetical protein DLM54_07395 [Acidimicrobiales bacterium]